MTRLSGFTYSPIFMPCCARQGMGVREIQVIGKARIDKDIVLALKGTQ